MKNALLIFALFATSTLLAQSDTVTMNNGTAFIGRADGCFKDCVSFTDTTGKKLLFYYDNISSLSVGYQYTTVEGKDISLRYTGLAQLRSAFKGTSFHDQRFFLRKAGSLGAASAAAMLIGGVLSGIGTAAKNPGLAYAGIGVGGVGFVMLFPTFSALHKAGTTDNYVRYPF